MASTLPNIPGTGNKIPFAKYVAGITDLFPNANRQRVIETAVNARERVDYMPINAGLNQTLNDKYIEYRINGTVGTLIDLGSISLELALKFTDTAGATVAESTLFTIANGISNTLFKSVNVFLNDRLIESAPFYNYVSYLKMLNLLKKSTVQSLGKCAFFNEETSYTSGVLSEYTAANLNKGGSYEKKNLSDLKSKGIETCFPLLLDISSLDMYLLDNVNIRVRLELANNSWIIGGPSDGEDEQKADGVRISVNKAVLWVDRVIPHFNAMSALNSSLNQKRNLEYMFDKTLVKTYIIGVQENHIVIENPFNNVIPEQMSLIFIDNQNFSGNISRNPLCFKPFGVKNISVSVNGNSIYNINMDWDNGYNLRAYYESLRARGVETADNVLCYDSFKNGRTVFTFNFINEDMRGAVPIEMSANMRITATFSTAPATPILALLTAQTVGILNIDSDRNVQCDLRG